MNFILFDENRAKLLPLSYTRPIAAFRCGILTLKEKWEKRIPEGNFSFMTEAYLQEKFPLRYSEKNFYMSGNLLSSDELVDMVHQLQDGEAIVDPKTEAVLVGRSSKKLNATELAEFQFKKRKFPTPYERIEQLWDVFTKNAVELEKDFTLLTDGRVSEELAATNTHIGERLFIEKGAKVQGAILNSTSGPIYIGENAEVMEGTVVRGGLALCEGSTLKLSAKIYGATTIGPHSKVGGEVNNSVILGFSNKGHDGFLGNSVIGEWCNLGADTNVSNLKNNYASIKLWDYEKGGFKDSGQQFCGLMMGDHSKSGINTMFNTATVVGVSANIYGGGFPRSFIPSYSWGGSEKWVEYRFEKAMEVAERVMERRNKVLDEVERKLLKHIFEQTSRYRNF